jgi:predicted GNAT family acetyltransferase
MGLYKVVELSTNDWERYKKIRLQSLLNDPQAFGSNYEKERAFTQEKWESRVHPYSEDHKQWNVEVENESGEIVGMTGAFSPEPGVAMIVGVYVSKEHRGKGLATMLMDAIFEKIRQTGGYKIVKLSVNSEQASAVALYKKAGFAEVGEEKATLGDGKEHFEILMELKL